MRGMYCLTMAHDLDSTIKIFDICNRMYDAVTRPELCDRNGDPRFHWKRASANRRELKYDEADSVHFVGTAGNLNFGHGLTIQRVHLSEAARFPELDQTLAAIEGVPASGEVIAESTPHGAVGPYYELNQQAYLDPDFEWSLIFLVWYDYDYALPVHGRDEEYEILLEVQNGSHPRFGNEEKALCDRLRAEKHVPLTAGQWKFRRWKRGSLRERFYEQYPEDFVTCWLASGRPFFDLLKVMATPSKDVIRKEEHGAAWVYEEAIAGRDYVIWADPAQGLERGTEDDASDEIASANRGITDFSAWGIIDRETNEDVLVSLSRITVGELARQIDKWGRIYNEALAVPERNNHGSACILALIEIYHYPNLYHHLDGLNDDGTEDRRPGWPTMVNNRTTMLDNFDMEVREGSYTMIDPRMRAQALTFIVNAKGRAEAGPTYFDDLITGRAIGNEVVRQPKNFGIAMIG